MGPLGERLACVASNCAVGHRVGNSPLFNFSGSWCRPISFEPLFDAREAALHF